MSSKDRSSAMQFIAGGIALCAISVVLILVFAQSGDSPAGRGGTLMVIGLPAGLLAISIGLFKLRRR